MQKAENVLILTHHNADIDAVGSAIGLQELLDGKADLAAAESISTGAKDLAKDYSFKIDPDLDYELVVVLDCSSKEQVDPIDIESSSSKKIIIDHHTPGNLENIADKSLIKPSLKSTAEIIYNLGKKSDLKINKKAAKGLICGMVADTSHLKLADKKHFEYISELLSLGDRDYSDILSILHNPPDFSERIAKIKAASRIEGYRADKKIIALSSIRSFEAASARAFLRMGADLAVVFCQRKDQLRISARCRRNLTEEIHLAKDLFSKLEKKFPGSAGGHDAAASANLKKAKEEDVRLEIKKNLEKILGKNLEKL